MARRYTPLILFALLFVLGGCAADGSSGNEVNGLRFTDVTASAGLKDFKHITGAAGDLLFPESMGSGCGWIDYNGDGWPDILVAGGGEWIDRQKIEVIRLYKNNTDGTFTEVSREAGLSGVNTYSLGFSVADYDNDGDEDFYLPSLYKNLLFRNDGGRFVEVGEAAGVDGGVLWSSSAAFFDADRDGFLDLYAGNYVRWSLETDIYCSLDGTNKGYCTPETYPGAASRFYHNNGDGTFSDWTERAGFWPASGKTLGVTELDYNHDGWPDLAVSNDTEPTLLYENNGDGTFTERGQVSGVAYDEQGHARAGMGIDAGILDDTGEPTIIIGNFSREMIAVFRHEGNGLFEDRAGVSEIGRTALKSMSLTFGIILLDVDLDGDLDVLAANGHVQPDAHTTTPGVTYRQPPHLFLNDGNARFTNIASDLGGVFANPIVARGSAVADYDRDGDLDILISESDGPLHLWRNDLAAGKSLRLDLVGTTSNRQGLGTRVVAIVGGKRMERRARTALSYLSASEPTVTFGIGTAEKVDSLLLFWPGGQVDRFANIPANQHILVTEGSGRFETKTPKAADGMGSSGF